MTVDNILIALLATANMELASTLLAYSTGSATEDEVYNQLATLMRTLDETVTARDASGTPG